MNRVEHPFPPLYDAHSRLLILGSLPSPQSRAQGFFYMHPQNRFWPVLARVFDEPTPIGKEARAAFALRHGIALWDVLASCEISGASDAAIKHPVANDLTALLSAAPIQKIYTTGKKSTDLYRKYIFSQTGIAAIGLPSTSPANCAVGLETLCAAYRVVRADE